MTAAASANLPRGGRAVMERRASSRKELDDFPTPPWATRAFLRHVMPRFLRDGRAYSAWEPACGRGLMAEVLKERFATVYASDVHDYGCGYPTGHFVADPHNDLPLGDAAACPFRPDWIVTNPPFKIALEFAERALREAAEGVALLCRTAFVESVERYAFFQRHPFSLFCPYAERVPITQGRWDPDATTMTSYAWFVWKLPPVAGVEPRVKIIPPGCAKSLTLADDAARFAARRPS